jgi:hypothetical protein
MTAVVIALAVLAWLIVLVLCLGLARSAAFGDALVRGRRRGPGHQGREAASRYGWTILKGGDTAAER